MTDREHLIDEIVRAAYLAYYPMPQLRQFMLGLAVYRSFVPARVRHWISKEWRHRHIYPLGWDAHPLAGAVNGVFGEIFGRLGADGGG